MKVSKPKIHINFSRGPKTFAPVSIFLFHCVNDTRLKSNPICLLASQKYFKPEQIYFHAKSEWAQDKLKIRISNPLIRFNIRQVLAGAWVQRCFAMINAIQ